MSTQFKPSYEFGPYCLSPEEGLLLREGEIVPLAPKALDLLVALVENNGHVISKDALMKRVWPDSFVEESNLSHHVFVLRKALGEDRNGAKYIETIPRRGYRFVASVTEVEDASNDLVVAERTRSHIVIDEEHDASASVIGQATPAKALAGDSRLKRKTLLLTSIISLAVLVGLTVAVYFWITNKPAEVEPTLAVKTIAVLPFKPLVADSRDESLELGMADTLINKLSPIRQLIVRPISDVRKYTGLEQNPIAAGRELGVDYVVEGNLLMVGEKTRMTVRLLSVKDGSAIWADKCDQACSNIFELQDAIAERIAGALALRLSNEEKKQLAKHYTENTEAYQLALKGRFYWNKWTPDGFKKAIEYCNQAVEKDPNYAPAYSWMGSAYQAQGNAGILHPKEANIKAKELAEKALKIDNDFDNGHYLLGAVKLFYDWDWPGAERELRRAIELNSNNVEGRMLYVYYLMITGRPDESISEAKRCEELSPVSVFVSWNVGDMLYLARRYDEAIAQYRKTLELDPYCAEAHYGLGYTYIEKGMNEDAIVEVNRGIELDGDKKETSRPLGYIYARTGKRAEVQAILARLEQVSKSSYVDSIGVVRLRAALGEKDRAFEWFEKAYNERRSRMIWLTVDPRLDSLRQDPRFASLQRRVGLFE
jgi:DNA-binding winged helix-turn-helix (wHTH) protein/TolB-like protein/Tfp pilus assembly protein PilF